MKKQNTSGRNRQRTNIGLRSRLTTRTVILVSAILLAIGALLTIITLNLSNPSKTWANTTGDYQTVASGNWSSTSTWARWNGSTWVTPAPSAPSSASGVITVLNGHTVVINSAVTADQLVIAAGGTLDLQSNTLTVANGTGDDVRVNGVLRSASTITINSTANIVFSSGSTYRHAFTTTQGTIPAATWDANSTCEISGYTSNSNSPSNLAQSFGNFVWNCPGQTSVIAWSAIPTGFNNLTITSTGSSEIQIANVNTTIPITGNYTQSGGIVNLNTANNRTTTLNISGNWMHTGGTLLCGGNSGTNGNINFNKAGTQTFTAAGNTVTGNIDFNVSSGTTLDVGTSIVLGRDFNLPSGAAMIIGSPSGIQSSGNSGNVQSSRTRTFNSGADYIFNGTAEQQTGAGFPAQVRNLTFNNASGVILTNNVTVSGQLRLDNGVVIASGDTLTLGTSAASTGTLTRTNGYVSGTFRRWIATATANNILFPVGSSAYYNGAEFDFTAAPAVGGSIIASFISSKPDATGLPLTDGGESCMNIGYGYWQFVAANSFSGGTYSVRLSATGMPGISDPPSLHLVRRASAGSAWTGNGSHQPGTGTVSNPVVNRIGMTALGQYGIISSSSNVLPIELIYFRANWNNGRVDLTWSTASETNNDHFTVERSVNGEAFTSVVELAGSGTTSQTHTYTSVDRNPLKGRSYYRLKQTDFDGTYTYSDLRVVNNPAHNAGGPSLEITSVYPNPCGDKFNIAYKSSGNPVRIMLFNAEGKMMHDDELDATDGTNLNETVDMHSMPAGTYYVYLASGEERLSKKILHR